LTIKVAPRTPATGRASIQLGVCGRESSRSTSSLSEPRLTVMREIADAPVCAERVLAGIDAAIDAGLRPVATLWRRRQGCGHPMPSAVRHRLPLQGFEEPRRRARELAGV
jgi:hypothetical protein